MPTRAAETPRTATPGFLHGTTPLEPPGTPLQGGSAAACSVQARVIPCHDHAVIVINGNTSIKSVPGNTTGTPRIDLLPSGSEPLAQSCAEAHPSGANHPALLSAHTQGLTDGGRFAHL